MDKKKQKTIVSSLVYELTGKRMRHSKTGKPIVGKSIDVSVSHKDNYVCASSVPSPYRIGIDIENLQANINAKLFIGSVITENELLSIKKFCSKNNFSHQSGIILFWSIKESFFKCLDYDLKPGKISVTDVSKKGEIQFHISDEIKDIMEKRHLKLYSTNIAFQDKYVLSQTIMKKITA